MRLEHLHYLLCVAQHHSISAAARELFISQTALSAIVNKTEDELGFPVFERVRDGVVPTEEGKEVLSNAWDILSRWQDVIALGTDAEKRLLPVSILASPSIMCGLTLPLMHRYQEKVPRGQLRFHEVVGMKVGAEIVQSNYNIGLTYFSPDGLDDFSSMAQKYQVQITPVYDDKIYLIARRDHPIYRQKTVDIMSLTNERFAILPQFLYSYSRIFYSQSMDPSNRITVYPNVPLVKTAVLRWNVLGVMSGYAATQDHSVDNSELAFIPLPNQKRENTMKLYLIHQRLSNLHQSEKIALECIQEYFSSLPPLSEILPQ